MRETEREKEVEGQRERKSQAGFTLSVQSPTRGSNPWTVRSWPEPKSRVRHLTDWATQAPQLGLLLKYLIKVLSGNFFWVAVIKRFISDLKLLKVPVLCALSALGSRDEHNLEVAKFPTKRMPWRQSIMGGVWVLETTGTLRAPLSYYSWCPFWISVVRSVEWEY